MLHGLSEPQIGGERERRHKVGQPEPRVAIRAVHPLSLGKPGDLSVELPTTSAVRFPTVLSDDKEGF